MEVSCVDQNLVTDEVEADRSGRVRMVKVKGRHGFSHLPAQLLPRVSLGDNTLSQTLSDEPTVRFLVYLENYIIHTRSLFHYDVRYKATNRDVLNVTDKEPSRHLRM